MIARGSATIAFAPAVTMVGIAVAVLLFETMTLSLLTIPFGLVFLALLVIFRDPARGIGPGIVSPADGRVVVADRARRRIVIAVGLAGVHVNRAPSPGVVEAQRYERGMDTRRQLEWAIHTDEGTWKRSIRRSSRWADRSLHPRRG